MGEHRQRITIEENGPYAVSGGLPLTREEIVYDDDGVSSEWRLDERLEPGESYRLCRCGRSRNKPFCDESHLVEPRFDGTETADRTPTKERRRTFNARGISVGDDLPLCASAAFCDAMDGDVWSFLLRSRDPEIRDRIMHMIDRCPSGRLTYALPPDDTDAQQDAEQNAEQHAEQDVERDLEPTVAVVRDGPYWVRGGVEIVDEDGEAWEVRNRVALCRCGESANKPFCDGTHKVTGFRDPVEAAVSGETAASPAAER
ncbi:MAG TPA: CDGSH iron-sulfur domain-containing protein [Actinomycetota bacterium]|jgi:CDGSH-type Zn-finger protein